MLFIVLWLYVQLCKSARREPRLNHKLAFPQAHPRKHCLGKFATYISHISWIVYICQIHQCYQLLKLNGPFLTCSVLPLHMRLCTLPSLPNCSTHLHSFQLAKLGGKISLTDHIVWRQRKEPLPFPPLGTRCLLVRGPASCKISNGHHYMLLESKCSHLVLNWVPFPHVTLQPLRGDQADQPPWTTASVLSFSDLREDTFHNILQVAMYNVATIVIVQCP